MKVQRNYKENEYISSESKTSLEDFKKHQIQTNIKLHKIFIAILSIINTALIGFLIFYKSKISSLQTKNIDYSAKIYTEEKEQKIRQNSLNHKIVNVAAAGNFGGFLFCFLLENMEELEMLKNFIINYHKGNPYSNFSPRFNYLHTLMIYQGGLKGDNYTNFIDIVSYYSNIVFLIQTVEGNRFGVYFEGPILIDEDNNFNSNSSIIFAFSFQSKQFYRYKNINTFDNIKMNNKTLLNIGDGDIIIYNEFLTKGGKINFPFKNFDTSTVNSNVFTERGGSFAINDIEVLCIS